MTVANVVEQIEDENGVVVEQTTPLNIELPVTEDELEPEEDDDTAEEPSA